MCLSSIQLYVKPKELSLFQNSSILHESNFSAVSAQRTHSCSYKQFFFSMYRHKVGLYLKIYECSHHTEINSDLMSHNFNINELNVRRVQSDLDAAQGAVI